MQTARAYDTHKMIKEMIALGFNEKQSEGVVNLFGQIQNDLVTKADLREVKFELKSEIQEVRSELQGVRAEIRETKQAQSTFATKSDLREIEMRLENKMLQLEGRLIKWGIGSQIAAVTIILGFLKLFY